MNLLCILDKLPAADVDDPDAYNKKGGSYPTALRALASLGYDVTLAVIHRHSERQEAMLADQLGCRYLCDDAATPARDLRLVRERLNYPALPTPNWSWRTRLHKARKYRRQKKLQIAGAARALGEIGRAAGGGRRFDHVFALTNYGDAGLLAAIVAERLDCPFSVWEHQTLYARNKMSPERIRRTREAALRAHVTCTVSPQLRDEIARTLGDDIALDVLPNPVGSNFFEPPTAEARAEVERVRGDGFLFAAWTAWRDFKRLDLALEAFARVVVDGRDARLLIAGKPPSWAQAHVRRLGIAERVTFVGNVSRERIQGIAHGCDCVLVPSDCETFAQPVTEGLAGGNPVVATRCGGPESIIVDERLGYIVECGDIDAFAERMRAVMDTRDQYDDAHLRDWCRAHYGEPAFARACQALLETGATVDRPVPT